MKVVYIGPGNWVNITGSGNSNNDPIKDHIYTVVDSDVYMGDTFYQLKECGSIRYNADNFIPLDGYLNQFTANLVEELENCQLVEA